MLEKTTPSNEFDKNQGEKWFSCWSCGEPYLFVRIPFTSGSVQPALGETLTGALSGATGVVNRVDLHSGSYADGDAVGEVYLVDPTGFSMAQWECFYADETVNGSVGGTNILTVTSEANGILGRQGRLYPESQTGTFRGRRYCLAHLHMVSDKRLVDESRVDITEGDREDGF